MTGTASPLPLRVDIVSDVVCPWCIIGYRQFMKALDSLPDRFDVELHWHPFELNPWMPPEGQNLREHIAQKYGTTPEQSRGSRKRMSQIGESLGFHFDYHEDMRMVNTFRAHQLLHWAALFGLQTALKLRLFAAFFSERQDVSDTEVLVNAAEAVGLPAVEARALLADGRYAETVREEQQIWLDRDVHAVPTFFINEQYAIPGAQEAETFVRLLQKIEDKLTAGAA